MTTAKEATREQPRRNGKPGTHAQTTRAQTRRGARASASTKRNARPRRPRTRTPQIRRRDRATPRDAPRRPATPEPTEGARPARGPPARTAKRRASPSRKGAGTDDDPFDGCDPQTRRDRGGRPRAERSPRASPAARAGAATRDRGARAPAGARAGPVGAGWGLRLPPLRPRALPRSRAPRGDPIASRPDPNRSPSALRASGRRGHTGPAERLVGGRL